jgi:hypothetical protein
MRSEPERWASMRSPASRAAAAQPSETAHQENPTRRLAALMDDPSIHRRKTDWWAIATLILAVMVCLAIWGGISLLGDDPLYAFLILLVFMGGPFAFMYVLARFPETRLGKVCQEILTVMAMFGGGQR